MNEAQRLTGIYHETQEGSLCAQHALNNLLQREIFSAISLADIARVIDEQEQHVLGNRTGVSENMDDSGYFSIQVLQRALHVFDIELVPYASQHLLAQEARQDPQKVQAYICNLREHWLTIRRFGQQYFDLNSISSIPKLISNTYLSLYLTQLQQSGYSIFLVNGILPPCPADDKLLNNTIDHAYYRSLTERIETNKDKNNKRPKMTADSSSSFDEDEIQRAIKASVELDNSEDKALQQVLARSLRDANNIGDSGLIDGHDPESINTKLLDQAIAASLEPEKAKTHNDQTANESTEPVAADVNVEELRRKRLEFYSNTSKQKSTTDEQLSNSNK